MILRMSTNSPVMPCIHLHGVDRPAHPHVHLEDLVPESEYRATAPIIVVAEGQKDRQYARGMVFRTPAMSLSLR